MIKTLVLFVDNVFFLGHGELEKAKNFHKSSKKLIYFPFSVDTDFWTKDSKLNSKTTKQYCLLETMEIEMLNY